MTATSATEAPVRINCRARFLDALGKYAPDVQLDKLLYDSDIHLEDLYENGLTAPQYAQLLDKSAIVSGQPLFPLQVGLEAEIAEFGIYGYSMLSCSDPNRMVRIAVDYQPLSGYGFGLDVTFDTDRLSLNIEDNDSLSNRENFLLLLEYLGATVAIMASLFSASIEHPVVAVDFPCPEPDFATALRDALPFPLDFDQQQPVIHLDPRILEVDIDHHGAELNALFLQRCDAEMERIRGESETDTTSQVQALIYRDLREGVPTQQSIAQQLHLSPRTMNRRLSEQSTSFSRLLTQCRMELASKLLADGDLSIQEISFRLGYAQPNSFFRAYRKYFGTSPRATVH